MGDVLDSKLELFVLMFNTVAATPYSLLLIQPTKLVDPIITACVLLDALISWSWNMLEWDFRSGVSYDSLIQLDLALSHSAIVGYLVGK